MAGVAEQRRVGRRRLALAVAVLVLLVGCGDGATEVTGPTTPATDPPATAVTDPSTTAGGEATRSTTVPSTAATTTRPPASGGTTTTSARAGSVLQRRDAPPEGIKAQFEFFQEGNGSCRGLDKSRPAAVVELPQPTIAMLFVICFPGFVPNRPVQAEVRLPDGTSRRMDVDSYDINEGVAQWYWYSLPGDPVGRHTVTARQQGREGTGSFTVARATTPRLLVPPPNEGPPGTTFRVAMAGFSPNTEVPFYLYRRAGGPYEYVTSLTVRFDARGEATHTFATRRDDPKGSYCLLFRGAKAAPDYACGDGFTIT
ncbi:MAG: hypothetical protein M3203_00805 [Actinomycetota bacterium]|nr:hypothetical protein [Actinomycetota bacterium]